MERGLEWRFALPMCVRLRFCRSRLYAFKVVCVDLLLFGEAGPGTDGSAGS